MWGEFVDLTNGRGDDSAGVKWDMGEELPGGGLRNMADGAKIKYFSPITGRMEAYPQRYKSEYVKFGSFDNGGVHINSGIANKLCFLLTDGGVFNGETVAGLGVSKAADLIYEVQTNLLTKGASYFDFGILVNQAAVNLGFDVNELGSVLDATQAVEILPPGVDRPVRHLRATTEEGVAQITLTWQSPTVSEVVQPVTLVRRTDRFAMDAADGDVLIDSTLLSTYLDTNVTLGQQYFYSVFAPGSNDFARAIAGQAAPDYKTQNFVHGNTDLPFTQITFDPVFDITEGVKAGSTTGYTNYTSYITNSQKDVFTLPIDPTDAIYLSLTEDGVWTLSPRAPIPFFGKMISVLGLASNGYVANFDDINDAQDSAFNIFNFPSLDAHYLFPRISLLFADLSPASGGVVWIKDLEDRFVITFERVPEFGEFRHNTAQLELFYGGRIRMTFMEINAEDAVVGLSDGNGASFSKQTDLSNASTPPRLIIEPTPTKATGETQPVSFTVNALPPDPGVQPEFSYGWVQPDGLPAALPPGATFTPATGNASTAIFNWTPGFDQSGYYVIRVTFKQGAEAVSEDVQVIVGDKVQKPTIERDLEGNEIVPEIIPSVPRDTNALLAVYKYFHPEGAPEGDSIIYWFKNGVFLSAYTNLKEVPASATEVGDAWNFLVIPVTTTDVQGDPHVSKIVTIVSDLQPDVNKDGMTDAVDLQNVVNGVLRAGEPSPYQDVNGDQLVDAVDVQALVNAILIHIAD